MNSVAGRTVGRSFAVALLAAAAFVPAATAHADSSSATGAKPLVNGVFHWIRNTNSGMCLEPEGQSTASGAAIVQQPCQSTGTESLAQGWSFTQVGTNHYKFVNQLSGLCLNTRYAVNGGDVYQWPCAQISNQEYNTGTKLPAVAKIESRIHWGDTGFCVNVRDASTAAGAGVKMASCNGAPSQTWINGY